MRLALRLNAKTDADLILLATFYNLSDAANCVLDAVSTGKPLPRFGIPDQSGQFAGRSTAQLYIKNQYAPLLEKCDNRSAFIKSLLRHASDVKTCFAFTSSTETPICHSIPTRSETPVVAKRPKPETLKKPNAFVMAQPSQKATTPISVDNPEQKPPISKSYTPAKEETPPPAAVNIPEAEAAPNPMEADDWAKNILLSGWLGGETHDETEQ